MRKTLLTAFIAAFIFASCNSSGTSDSKTETAHHEDHDHDHAEHGHAKNDSDYESIEVIKSDVSAPVLDAYFAIKKALQEDNQAEAANSRGGLRSKPV